MTYCAGPAQCGEAPDGGTATVTCSFELGVANVTGNPNFDSYCMLGCIFMPGFDTNVIPPPSFNLGGSIKYKVDAVRVIAV